MNELLSHNSAERMLIEKAGRMQLPIMATFELSPLCNLNCRMCFVRRTASDVEKNGGLQPVDNWRRLAEILQRQGVLFITLTGGEPLLYPGFRELYIALHELGMIVTVNTNGTLINEEWAAFFNEIRPRRINITLYGASADTYGKVCGSPAGFEKTLQGIRLLKQYDLPVKISSSLIKDNYDDLETMYGMSESLDCPLFIDTYMIPKLIKEETEQNCDLRLSPEQYAEAELLKLQNQMDLSSFESYVKELLERTETGNTYPDVMTCLAGNCSFCVSWDGRMKACVSMAQSDIRIFDDLSDETAEKAWQQLSAVSKELKINAQCTTCRYRSLCRICAASAYLETGEYSGLPEYVCRCAQELYRLLKEYDTGHDRVEN